MPITATPCGPPRWRAGWKSWVCSGPSPDHECRMTTRTRNRCSGRPNTVLTTRDGLLPARMMPASGWRHLRTGTVRRRHSGIKFVTPHQRHNGDAVEICQRRAVVYEQARKRHPRRWSRSTRCWYQPEVVWINPPTPESEHQSATFAMSA